MLSVHHRSEVLIRGGRVIDPFHDRDEVADVGVRDGVFVAPAALMRPWVVDAAGCTVCPGLMDIHVHLREPGGEHKETIETGCRAAAAGGFTHVACMPNTTPPLDSPDTLALVRRRAAQVDLCAVYPVACTTTGRRGETVVDITALKAAGAFAFSDDGAGVERDDVMREAFEAAAKVGAVLIQHCEFRRISAGGVMHSGEVSRRLGLPGLDPRSEEAMIERDLDLCRKTGARYHVAHISTGKAVELVRRARRAGLPVTAEVCTHHLLLTDEACAGADPNTKMHPPLRARHDVDACRAGLLDGTIDCIVTDHAPHAASEKAAGFLNAPPGIIGLETSLAVSARAMIHTGLADWRRWVEWMTSAPARVLGIERAGLAIGAIADVAVIDPAAEWTVDPQRFESKSRNTPFAGWTLTGRALMTIRGRRVVEVRSAAAR